MTSALVILISLWLTVVVVERIMRRRRLLPLPPGPKGLPIVGNLFNRPTHNAWLAYTDWGSTYGSDIVAINVGGQPLVVLNSTKAADDLLEKRSGNYSDRPSFYMACELMQWKWDFGFIPYSSWWRLHRKTFHQYFNSNEVGAYESIQWSASVALVKEIIRQPDNFRHHIRHHIASIVLRVAYGYEVQPKNDKFVQVIDKAMQEAGWAMVQGNYLVDYFPILRFVPAWFPFASFITEAEIAAKDALEVLNAPFVWTMKAMAEGRAEASFVSRWFERLHLKATDELGQDKEIVEVIKNCAGLVFAAGADTTTSAVVTTLIAMILNPDVQRKAQKELDAVVGRTRPPSFEDQSNLPFLHAVILEALRWRPVLPLGIAHANVNDDVYDGYRIPAGSTVVTNVWAMMHDEAVYPNPETFDPERFLGPKPQPDPTKGGVFGFGRRVCAGRYFAMKTAFIQVACLLWAFELGPEKGSDGNDILPDPNAYVDRVILHPLPFGCKFTPRIPNVESIIEEASVTGN